MNAYFQLMNTAYGTGLRLVPASGDGEGINVSEMTNYLMKKNILVKDTKLLYQALTTLTKEVVVPLNDSPCLMEREMMSLRISDDQMSAIARFYPPSNHGGSITDASEIINDCKHQKVIFGFDEGAIQSFLRQRNYCEDIVIAKGKAPVHGKDAWIEYFFNTDLSVKPMKNEDGSVDFHHLNTINHCKAGDVLAKLHRETPGEKGMTVLGTFVKSRDVKLQHLKYGNNIDISEDHTTLISRINGHVCLTGDKVFVSNVYEVENVGPATGNIESEGSVVVNGNVQTGFTIQAKGNVEVKGVVEGAIIEADGDIIVARGINGMGKGRLVAGGRVVMKFAENATIISGADVTSESMLHCKVSAKNNVEVDGKKGFIAGGMVRATNQVVCKTLGSAMGADTLVEVGVDPETKKEFQALQKELMENQTKLSSIQPILVNLTGKIKQGVKLNPEQMKYFQSLVAANKQLTESMEASKERLLSLDQMMKWDNNACVCVSNDAFPGTKIAIGDVSMVLKQSVKYCRFMKDKGEIRISAL